VKNRDVPNLLRATGSSEDGKLVVALSMLNISSGNCLERRKLAGLVAKSRPVSGDLGAKNAEAVRHPVEYWVIAMADLLIEISA